MDLYDSFTLQFVTFHFRILEQAQLGPRLKKEQRFERLDIDLMKNKSWKEKVCTHTSHEKCVIHFIIDLMSHYVLCFSIGCQASFAFDCQGICHKCASELGGSPPHYFLCKLLVYENAKRSQSPQYAVLQVSCRKYEFYQRHQQRLSNGENRNCIFYRLIAINWPRLWSDGKI